MTTGYPLLVATPLPFVEAFGPTLQGEGPQAGWPVAFLRLGGCNLSCSWCDSGYTWDASRYNLREQITMASVEQILAQVPAAPGVVVTGGEPLIHQQHTAWADLLTRLGERFPELHLETNGTIAPTSATVAAFDYITVSPKLPNAGAHKRSQSPVAWNGWATIQQAVFKVVCRTAEDVHRAVELAQLVNLDQDRLWVMPEGQTVAELAVTWPVVAAEAARLGVRASHRLHVLAWGPDRGH